MNNKIQKNLQFTCSTCFSFFQLLEIHEKESNSCSANCQEQWKVILSKHYRDCIILHIALEEAKKEAQND